MLEVESEIIHGQKLGSRMGFPTANMDIAGRDDIPNGVYRSVVEVDGVEYTAMSNVGVRPSVDGKTRLLETHLFGYDGDLYGHQLRMEFHKYLRGERKFDSLEALKEEVMRNARQTRDYFAQQG